MTTPTMDDAEARLQASLSETLTKLKSAEQDLADARHGWEQAAETIRDLEAHHALDRHGAIMTLYQFLNGIRILWNINAGEYLSCINQEDRDFFGDDELWERFRDDPHKTFSGLPEQDQQRIFALIDRRNTKAGIGT